jgi:uncharacterized protein (TIGR03083 family)
MMPELPFLEHLVAESHRFVDALGPVPSDARVPSCPDWDADDLLWHLGEVQWFWGTVVARQVTGDEADEAKPARPPGRPDLLAFFDRAHRDLMHAVTDATDQTPTWTWSSDHSVGFVRRRQAHEALIHRVDAELTAEAVGAGRRTPMDAGLSADGVDEALRIMYGEGPTWGRFTPDGGGLLRVRATDTGRTWLVTLGRFVGTSPATGISYDQPDLRTAASDDGGQAAATVGGTAADLDCWLWHRDTFSPVEREGSPQVLAAFDAAIAEGVT